MMGYLIGLDLGGTKIEAAIIHSRSLEIVDRQRVDTNAHLGYDHILKAICNLVNHVMDTNKMRFDQLGIGTPGTVDPQTMTMKNCNTTALNGRSLVADLTSQLNMKIRISNDANCFAIAEASLGAVQDVMPHADVVFGVIMGTGTGGGLVVNGKVINGRNGIGGEWGHNHLDDSGGPCYCGKNGCVEMVISGPALERYYETQSGEYLKMASIVDRYRSGTDPFASKTMERLFTYFGKAISVVINIVDPDVIVIGGGLGNIDELYTYGLAAIKAYVFNPRVDTIFIKPKLGDSAGVFGAALLWQDENK
jgi:fructokinase